MRNLLGTVRYALRQFRAAPVFTAAAVATLALGIGGTTAIFTLIHAVMLRSLPVSDPALLYRVGDGDDCCVQGGPQDRWGMYSYPLVERLKASMPEFEEVTAFQAGGGRLAARRAGMNEAARPLRSEYVTGNYFSTLGVPAYGGRTLTPEDDRPAAPPVAVLSHHAWQSFYGGDPKLVGTTIVLDGHPFTIVGVTPPGFFGETLRAAPPEIWIPVNQEPLLAGDGSLLRQPVSAWLRVIGRLKPGASVEGLGPRLTQVLRTWLEHDSGYPAVWMPEVIRMIPRQVIEIVPAGAGVGSMREAYGRSLRILLTVCGLVLLIACANVANLLLARAASRRGQTALRLAVGASPRQVVWQALVESVMLSLAGGLVGLLVAVGAAELLLALAFSSSRFLPISTSPSPVVLAFTFGVSLLTGILFGAAPAWFATRTDPVEALRGAGRTTGDRSGVARTGLLVVQATLSVVLVAGATMLGRSLNNLEGQHFGYAIDGRMVVALNRPPSTYTPEALQALYRRLEDRVSRLPGVRGTGLALYNPLTDNWGELIFVAGHPPPKMAEEGGSSWNRVSTHYLQHFGVRLVRGRFFSESDTQSSEPVAIVNETFVKRFFKSTEDPLAQRFGIDVPENAGTYRIVGVVADAKFAGFSLDKPARPMFFVPMTQAVAYENPLMARIEAQSHRAGGMMLLTDMPPGVLEPQLTRAVAEVDPDLTIINVRSMREQVALAFDQERAVATLAGLFGGIALLLAAVGLYGVTAYTVAQRTTEIGLRMALGADRPSVVKLVLRGAFARVLTGLALGIPLAIGAGRLISAQLYDVSFWDPAALGLAALALTLSALVAALLPAGRAASIEPMRALRSE